MNICMCGSEATYPHAPDCPFPYYGMSEKLQQKWLNARKGQTKSTNKEKTMLNEEFYVNVVKDESEFYFQILEKGDNHPLYEEGPFDAEDEAREEAEEYVEDNGRALVLGSLLGQNLIENVIQETEHGNGEVFEVNPHYVREGISPREIRGDIEALRKNLRLIKAAIHFDEETSRYLIVAPKGIGGAFGSPNSAYNALVRPIIEAGGKNDVFNTLFIILVPDSINPKIRRKFLATWRGEEYKDDRRSARHVEAEYFVLTEDERDRRFREYQESFIEEIIFPDLPANLHSYFDRDKYISDVASESGYGPSLASYDGVEEEHMDFYIYKMC